MGVILSEIYNPIRKIRVFTAMRIKRFLNLIRIYKALLEYNQSIIIG